ncbi:MAG: diguanylate cyclase [Lachnospiraceae bacterium]|nr:diguanylate cyclase [Lachnospiraceae bacterium]
MSKILVVDDEPLILKVIKNILKDTYELYFATSAQSGIKMCEDVHPDLLLSDLYMPDTDGFEMYAAIKLSMGEDTPPVIFMTGENDIHQESKGFDLGASDFIYKPFYKDVLTRRIGNVLKNFEHIQDLTKEATHDGLTGFLNKTNVSDQLTNVCAIEEGVLMIIDIDNFKLVNDIYGHDKGDKILSTFADLIRRYTRFEDITGRIGGDEFIAFLVGVKSDRPISDFTARMNEQLIIEAKQIFGDDMSIPLGVSIGAVYVPKSGNDYEELFHMADKALYNVKQNGKHSFAIYNNTSPTTENTSPEEDMKKLSKIFEERSKANCALWVGQEAFSYIYRYMLRYIQSYHSVAYKVLFTVTPKDSENGMELLPRVVEELGEILKKSLRKSDIMMQSKANQFFLFLPEITEQYIEGVIWRTINLWEDNAFSKYVDLDYNTEIVTAETAEDDRRNSIF